MSVEGDLVIAETKSGLLDYLNVIIATKFNWKTGWLFYSFSEWTNNTNTVSELIIYTKTAGVPGFEITPLILNLFVITLLVYKKRE